MGRLGLGCGNVLGCVSRIVHTVNGAAELIQVAVEKILYESLSNQYVKCILKVSDVIVPACTQSCDNSILTIRKSATVIIRQSSLPKNGTSYKYVNE